MRRIFKRKNMLRVQVNLCRHEYVENCARDCNLSIKGSDLRKLESFARKEYTGFVKKPYKKMLKRKRESSEDEMSSVMSKDEMEKDLEAFVDKHKLPETNYNENLDETRLEQVKKFVFNGHKMNGLVNGTKEDVLHIDKTKMDMTQLKKNLIPTREDIENLSKRVEMLRNELKMKENNINESDSDDENDLIKELQLKLSKTVSLNSIILTTSKASMETEADSDTRLCHQIIEGCAGPVPFTLQLLIQRTKMSQTPVENARIIDLDLSIPKNNLIQEELEIFIEKMRNSRDVMLCFRGLEKYASWYLMRQKAFDYFITNKPSIASFNNDRLKRELLLRNINYNIRAIITWMFKVEETGHLTPMITLRVQRNRKASSNDIDNVVSKLPNLFQLMQELYGIERAISIVIDMMSI